MTSLVRLLDLLHWILSKWILNAIEVATLGEGCSLPKTIVVLRNCFFGDFVVAIPALRKLRSTFPQVRIVFLTATSLAPGWRDKPQDDGIFQLEPGLIDHVVRYTSEDLSTPRSRAALRARLGLIDFKGTISIALCYSADSLISRLKRVFLCFLLGIPLPLGLTGGRTFPAQNSLNRWRRNRADIAHQVVAAKECVDEALARLGLKASMPSVVAESTSQKCAEEGSNVLRIGVAPFTKQFVKEWPLQRFAEVMHTISISRPVQFEIYGAPEELAKAEELERLLEPWVKFSVLCGKLSPAQLRQHIERVALLLCVDSGPAHIASLVNTPVVAVFSQITLHNFWRPWGLGGELVSAEVPCAACDSRTGQCPLGTKACVEGVSSQEVVRRVEIVLGLGENA